MTQLDTPDRAGPNPLVVIEQRVLERAKDATGTTGQVGADDMRTLVQDEVRQWQLDHKHGLRPFDLAAPAMVVDRAMRNITGYGPSNHSWRTTTCGRS